MTASEKSADKNDMLEFLNQAPSRKQLIRLHKGRGIMWLTLGGFLIAVTWSTALAIVVGIAFFIELASVLALGSKDGLS